MLKTRIKMKILKRESRSVDLWVFPEDFIKTFDFLPQNSAPKSAEMVQTGPCSTVRNNLTETDSRIQQEESIKRTHVAPFYSQFITHFISTMVSGESGE